MLVYKSKDKGAEILMNISEQSKSKRLLQGRRRSIKWEIEKMYGCYDKCMYCGIDLKGNYHLDHIQSIAHGGKDDIRNLAITCPMCNGAKGTMSLKEYSKWLEHISDSFLGIFVKKISCLHDT